MDHDTAWSVSPLVVRMSSSSAPHPSLLQRPLDFKTDMSEFFELAWMGLASEMVPNLSRRQTLQPLKQHFRSSHHTAQFSLVALCHGASYSCLSREPQCLPLFPKHLLSIPPH